MRKVNLKILLISVFVVLKIFLPDQLFAQGTGGRTPTGPGPRTGNEPAQLQDLEIIFEKFAGYLLPTGAIIFFLVVVMGGFKYLTAMGDLAAITNAHRTLTFGLGGLLVVALAYLFLVVINKLTGANILDFKIFQP